MAKIYKGEQTREKIVAVAIDLFGKHGFDHVSLKMIGDQIGISQAAVSQHFGNKRNIIMRVRESVTKSNQLYVDSKVRPFDKPAQQIIDYCIANIDWGFKNRKLAQILVLTYYFSMVDEDFRLAQQRAVKIAVERIERHVIACSREDKTVKQTEIRAVADVIHQLILGTLMRELGTHRLRREVKDIEKSFSETIPLILGRGR